jgi:hypothetical protein
MSVKTLATSVVSTFDDFFEPWSELFSDGIPGKSVTPANVNISEYKNSYNPALAVHGLQKIDFKIDVNSN